MINMVIFFIIISISIITKGGQSPKGNITEYKAAFFVFLHLDENQEKNRTNKKYHPNGIIRGAIIINGTINGLLQVYLPLAQNSRGPLFSLKNQVL